MHGVWTKGAGVKTQVKQKRELWSSVSASGYARNFNCACWKQPARQACLRPHSFFFGQTCLGKESVCSCLEQIPFWIACLPSKVIPRLESHHYSIRVGLYFTRPILQQSARWNCLHFSGLPPIIESSFKTWDGQCPVWSRLSGSSRTSVCTVV